MGYDISLQLTAGQYLDLARKAPKNKSHEIEMVYYHKAIEVDPDNVEAHLKLGQCFEEIGEMIVAEIEYIKAFTSPKCDEVKRFDVALALGNLSLKRGDIKSAKYYAAIMGEDVSITNQDGEEVEDEDEEDEDEAMEEIEKMLEDGVIQGVSSLNVVPPKNSFAYGIEQLKEADKLFKQHELQKAMDVLEEINPDNALVKDNAIMALIYAHLAEEDYEGTIKLCEHYLATTGMIDIYVPMMQAYYNMDKFDEARKILLKIAPKFKGKYEILKMALRLNEHTIVHDFSKEKLEKDMPFSDIRVMYGKSLWNLGRKEEGRRQLGIVKNEYGPYFKGFYFQEEMDKGEILPYDRIGITNFIPFKDLIALKKDILKTIEDAGEKLDEELDKNSDLMYYIKFLIMFGPADFGEALSQLLFQMNTDSKRKTEIIDFALLYGNYAYPVSMKFLEDKIIHKRCVCQCVNVNGRVIDIYFKIDEDKFFALPVLVIRAAICAFGDIVWGSADKTAERVNVLVDILEGFFFKENEKAKPEWVRDELNYLGKARSMPAIVTALVAKVDSVVDETNVADELRIQLKYRDASKDTTEKYFRIMFPGELE